MPANLRLAPHVIGPEGVVGPNPIKVVLAEDHAAMRRSLRYLLDAEDEITVMAEAFDLDAVPRRVNELSPHVLILDLRLPNGSAVETIRDLRHSAPQTRVVVLTMETSPALAKNALAAGALGYVLKEHADRDLPAAIRAAVRGEAYVTPEVALVGKALRRHLIGNRND